MRASAESRGEERGGAKGGNHQKRVEIGRPPLAQVRQSIRTHFRSMLPAGTARRWEEEEEEGGGGKRREEEGCGGGRGRGTTWNKIN